MWYYTLNGDQAGPVSETELCLLLEQQLPESTLVWKTGMTEWTSYKNIEVFSDIQSVTNPGESETTEQQLASNHATQKHAVVAPFGAFSCFSYAWKLLAVKFGDIFLVCIVYLVCVIASASVFSIILDQVNTSYQESIVHIGDQTKLTIAEPSTSESILKATHELSIAEALEYQEEEVIQVQEAPKHEQYSPDSFMEMFQKEWNKDNDYTSPFASIVGAIYDQIIGSYLSIGLTVTLLAIMRGGKFNISQFFRHPIAKVGKVFIATIVYGILVFLGLCLLIFPGIYIAVRLVFFSTAIADKNLGIIDSMQYSMDITKGKFFNLLGLWFLNLFAVIAGFLCLLLGLIWAIPLAIISWLVAYETLRLHALKDE